MNRAFALACIGLASVAAIAQGPTTVWDEIEGEWVSLTEFTRRYSHKGPSALRMTQVGPTQPGFTADLSVLPEAKRPQKVERYVQIPKGPGRYRGWLYDFHGLGID